MSYEKVRFCDYKIDDTARIKDSQGKGLYKVIGFGKGISAVGNKDLRVSWTAPTGTRHEFDIVEEPNGIYEREVVATTSTQPTTENWVPAKLDSFKVGDKIKTSGCNSVYEVSYVFASDEIKVKSLKSNGYYTWNTDIYPATYYKLENSTSKSKFKWIEIDFKDLQPKDEARFDSGGISYSDPVIVLSLEPRGKLKVQIINTGVTVLWHGIADKYEKKVSVLDAVGHVVTPLANKQKIQPTDRWATLRSVFAPEADKPPKQISNYPHECPFCSLPSYNQQIKIDCTGNCEDSRKTH